MVGGTHHRVSTLWFVKDFTVERHSRFTNVFAMHLPVFEHKFISISGKAYLCVRRYPGLLAEMFYTAPWRVFSKQRGVAGRFGQLNYI